MAEYSVEDQDMAEMAIRVEELIEASKIRDWRRNPDVANRMMGKIDDFLYEIQEKRGVKISSADKDMIIEGLLDVARKRS